MKNSLKALMAVVVGSVGLMAAAPVEAGTTADITITVTVQFVSVAVADGAITFPTVLVGDDLLSSDIPDIQTVTNDGNVTEDYTLELTVVDQYLVGANELANSTEDTFVLQALFSATGDTDPITTEYGDDGTTTDGDDVVTEAAKAASATDYAWSGNNGDGVGVTAGTVLNLHFKYSAPDSVTSGDPEGLTVQIAASLSP